MTNTKTPTGLASLFSVKRLSRGPLRLLLRLLTILTAFTAAQVQGITPPREAPVASQAIFEDIGELIASTSYIHVHIEVPINQLNDRINLYHDYQQDLEHRPEQFWKMMWDATPESTHYEFHRHSFQTSEVMDTMFKNIAVQHRHFVPETRDRLSALRASFPRVKEDSTSSIRSRRTVLPEPTDIILYPVNSAPRNKRQLSSIRTRQKRFVGALLAAVPSMFMGFYNTAQIAKLQDEMVAQKSINKKIVHVLEDHDSQINVLNHTLRYYSSLFLQTLTVSPGLLEARLSSAESMILSHLDRSTRAIQSAQYHRLSSDFLNEQTLLTLMSTLHQKADSLHCLLLVEHPNDLFQIETSMLFDGNDLHLVLHVPISTKEARLTLYRLHPFPLAYQEEFFILPDVSNQLLALSNSHKTMAIELTTDQLTGCQKINRYFLCDKFGVLSTRWNKSCLGTIYRQDFKAARDVCQFQIMPNEERVFQVSKSEFIVYLPQDYTVSISCHNDSTQVQMLKRGSNWFHLSSGCKAEFIDHLVHVELDVDLASDIIRVDWKWETYDVIPIPDLQAARVISQLKDMNVNNPTLKDLQYLALTNENAHQLFFYTSAGGVLLISLSVAFILALACVLYKIRRRRKLARKLNLQQLEMTPVARAPAWNFSDAWCGGKLPKHPLDQEVAQRAKQEIRRHQEAEKDRLRSEICQLLTKARDARTDEEAQYFRTQATALQEQLERLNIAT